MNRGGVHKFFEGIRFLSSERLGKSGDVEGEMLGGLCVMVFEYAWAGSIYLCYAVDIFHKW